MSLSVPYISILIKALNEEDCIAACIESAICECEGLDFEIVLADSLSTDRTVAIASGYPIKIVQFESKADRGAGAAAQLAYQHASGQFIYMLDGDMTMQSGFLKQALGLLEQEPRLAGVGGLLEDTRVNNMFDRHRVKKKPSATAGTVKWLNGGGLYRREAIESVGYFAHRFIPAYEEAELGMRLRSKGWMLKRLPIAGVSHTGHDETTTGLLVRHWQNGYAAASGMLIRSGMTQGYWREACRINREPIGLVAIFLLAMFGFVHPAFAWLALGVWVGLLVMLIVKKKNVVDAAFSFFHWHYRVAGMVRGLSKSIDDPRKTIVSLILQKL
ncbi:glycosyltransferase [Chitinibacteraceae bacterium HSL-7]